MIRSFLIALAAIFVFIRTIQAADNADHQELLSKHYRLEKLEGQGPFPAVMMVSGCSGFDVKYAKSHYDSVQNRLVELGYVTLHVNYLAARNATCCRPDVPTQEVAADINIANEYLKRQPFVKKGAINVIGWSYGASGALHALGRSYSQEPVQVDAVVAYYPHCGFIWQRQGAAPGRHLPGTLRRNLSGL
jgi:dienelactone hydrolase